jgi:hypothetical protein
MAREICEIVVTRDGGAQGVLQEVIGSYTLDNGALTVKTTDPDDRTLQNLMSVPAVVQSNGNWIEVTAQEAPAVWFHNLDRTFRGTYLSASFVT